MGTLVRSLFSREKLEWLEEAKTLSLRFQAKRKMLAVKAESNPA